MTNIARPDATESLRMMSFCSDGTRTSATAVSSGIAMSARRRCPSSTLPLHREADDCQHHYAERHCQGVIGQLAGLRVLEDPSRDARELAGTIDAGVIDHTAIEGGDDASEPEDDVVDRPLVEVVDVELVAEERVEEGELLRRCLRGRHRTRPGVPRGCQAGADQNGRNDGDGPVEVELVRVVR